MSEIRHPRNELQDSTGSLNRTQAFSKYRSILLLLLTTLFLMQQPPSTLNLMCRMIFMYLKATFH